MLGIAHACRFYPRGGRKEKPRRAEFTLRLRRQIGKGSEACERTGSLVGKGKGQIIAAQWAPPNLVIQIRPRATAFGGVKGKMTKRGRGKRKGGVGIR